MAVGGGAPNYHHSAEAVLRMENVRSFLPKFWDHIGKTKCAMFWGSPVGPRVATGCVVKSQTGAPLDLAWNGYQAGTVRKEPPFLGEHRAKDEWRIRRMDTEPESSL